MTHWTLRPARPDDAEALVDIVLEATAHQGRPHPAGGEDEAQWREGFVDWSRESADGTDGLRVVEEDGAVVGRVRIERSTVQLDGRDVPCVRLCGLQLRPAVQNRGIGTAIVRSLQDEAAATGGVAELGVEHDNPGARRLYERLGFTRVGEDEKELQMRWSPGG